jgi:hypothetical protein
VNRYSSLCVSIILFLLSSLFLGSCLKELEDPVPGEAMANIYPPLALSYFSGVTDSIIINVEVFENPGFSVSAIFITKQFITLAGDSSTIANYELNISSEDTIAVFKQSITELFADVPINGNIQSEEDLLAGDIWNYTYKFTLANGSFLTKPSGTKVTFLCPSDLAGTFDVSHTPWCGAPFVTEATWTEVGDGVYETTDFVYGAYPVCYNWNGIPGGSLKINDVCNLIFPTGLSQFDEIYTFSNGSTSGASFTFDWENDYGESGTVTLTRQDGMEWPPLRTE